MKKKTQDVYFWQFGRRYLTEVVSMHKPATYQNYKSVIGQLNVWFGGFRLSEITRQEIQLYFAKATQTLAPKTIAQHWGILNGLLRYAEDEGLVEEFRKPRLVKSRRTPQPWWTLAEMRTLIRGNVGPLKILVMLLAETGCRIGEALALQTRHVDVAKKQLHIHQGWSAGVLTTPKTDSSYRTLALSDELCYLLSSFRVNQPDCFLFRDSLGRPWGPRRTRYWLDAACARLKLPKYGFHAFRRGNITMCRRDLRIPLEIVAGRVGHETGDITLDVYVQKVDDYDREEIQKIAEVLYGEMHEVRQSPPSFETPGLESDSDDVTGQRISGSERVAA